MNGYSIVDLTYLDSHTLIGRAQIRSILTEDCQVPPEIVDWMLERLERETRQIAELKREIHYLETIHIVQ